MSYEKRHCLELLVEGFAERLFMDYLPSIYGLPAVYLWTHLLQLCHVTSLAHLHTELARLLGLVCLQKFIGFRV